ncbi:hypothetical protein JW911_03510 [Candidatus Peregrinibacteria bacterium]|nr:hypothetical protein [Candidatus Peregrinibacteria bacterium]
MKKTVKSLLIFITLASVMLGMNICFKNIVYAQALDEGLYGIQQTTNLPTFDIGAHPDAARQQGASNITSVVYYAIDFMKLLIGGVAVIMIIITAIKLIIARKKVDDVWQKEKEHLIMIASAFVIIMIADVAVKNVFFGQTGEVYDTAESAQRAATEGTLQLKGIYNVALLIAGVLGVLMLILAGIKLLLSGGNEESMTKAKKQVTWLVIGLFILGIAEFVVQDLIFPQAGSQIPDVDKGRKLLVDFTNFASGFVVFAAILMGIYGGYLYIIGFGNDEKTGKAKKVFVGVIIALVLAAGAFALVNTVIQLKPGT